jgi:hypothetical protein
MTIEQMKKFFSELNGASQSTQLNIIDADLFPLSLVTEALEEMERLEYQASADIRRSNGLERLAIKILLDSYTSLNPSASFLPAKEQGS